MQPRTPTIFVFGSNLAGRHGAGSALEARNNWGAKYGVGVGRVGQSYAIPTKDHHLKVLPLDVIASYVRDFLEYAADPDHLYYRFEVVAIGCGLAGYKPKQIAPMFKGHSSNVILPREFKDATKTS